MAAGLQVRLSGPRVYGDRIAQEPWLNGTSPDPIPLSLSEGLALYTRAMMLMAGALALMALI
jgi:adenosylcobinamide-phosphate synthase